MSMVETVYKTDSSGPRLLDSDWSSQVRSCSKLHYKPTTVFTLCVSHLLKHLTDVTPPDTGPHRPNSFLFRAGLEPRIPAREAGALTRNAKG